MLARYPAAGALMIETTAWVALRIDESLPGAPLAWAISTMKPPTTVLATTMKTLRRMHIQSSRLYW